MYVPPPTVTPVAPPRNSRIAGGAPILAICCILCILFVIAAVIVLALIPVYVSKSNGNAVTTYQYIIGTNTSLGSTSYAAIALQIEKALGLPIGSVKVISASQTSSGKRKRREFVSTRRIRRSTTSYAYITVGKCDAHGDVFQALMSAGKGCNTVTSGDTTCSIGGSLASTFNPSTACGTTTTTTMSTVNVRG